MDTSTASPDLLADIQDDILLEHATKGQRFANFLIDIVICWILMFVVGSVIAAFYIASYISNSEYDPNSGSPISNPTGFNLMLYAVNYSIIILYYTIMEGACKGRTIGKLITGTVAMREDGTKLSWKNAFFRSLIRIIPFEPLAALFTNYPWHDDWTNTVVVKKRG